MRHPVIGIPVYRAGRENADYAMRRAYCEAVARAGGAPVLIPPLQEEILRNLYSVLDGLLLAGGGDVASRRYGSPDNGNAKLVDEGRDQLEITLTQWALGAGLPLLGICRGIQVLNVAAGGTLIQDIPSQVPFSLRHRSDAALPRNHIAHDIRVQPNSLLAAVLSSGRQDAEGDQLASPYQYGVNSYHHQAVDKLAPGFASTAHAADGIIEAIEVAPRSSFVLGVQWHPECMVPGDAAMKRLFVGFVGACRQRADTCQRREVANEAGRCVI